MRTVHDLTNDLCYRAQEDRAALYFVAKKGTHLPMWVYASDSKKFVEERIAQLMSEGADPFGFIWFDDEGCHYECMAEHPDMRRVLIEKCKHYMRTVAVTLREGRDRRSVRRTDGP